MLIKKFTIQQQQKIAVDRESFKLETIDVVEWFKFQLKGIAPSLI